MIANLHIELNLLRNDNKLDIHQNLGHVENLCDLIYECNCATVFIHRRIEIGSDQNYHRFLYGRVKIGSDENYSTVF